jgi:hypothetical protein
MTRDAPSKTPMRAIAAATSLAILMLPTFVVAGDAIVGPPSLTCGEMDATTERTASVLMWVQGYISGVNNSTPADFLNGVSAATISIRFLNVCSGKPHETVLDAARETVALLRMDYDAWSEYKRSGNGTAQSPAH